MKKILVWLSWWVDSAVAAYLLKKKWYDVVAGFMKNYISEWNNCTTYQDSQEAIKVADFLWIKILSFDLINEYNEKIINYIYEWYKKWITPNPDVFCNNLIKFDVFLKKALDLGFDLIATGHYARIATILKWNNPAIAGKVVTMKLLKWIDSNKDQSYFLSWLNQFQLSKSLFPIWELKKSEVRKIAKEIWLPNADRKDSQGLCFVWNIPIKKFLEEKLKHKKWSIIDDKWKKIWEHDGARFYTIWQRRWLNLLPDLYVNKIDVKNNIVYVWARWSELLNKKNIEISNRHRIADKYKLPIEISAKIRYRQEAKPAVLMRNVKYETWLSSCKLWNKKVEIEFKEKQRAIAPWQIAVAYIWDECIWNWIIN